MLRSSLVAPPDTSPDTKENQLSVCVSVYQEVLRGFFTQPLYLKGIDTLGAVGVQGNKNVFSHVGITAAVNVNHNKPMCREIDRLKNSVKSSIYNKSPHVSTSTHIDNTQTYTGLFNLCAEYRQRLIIHWLLSGKE